MKEVKFGNYKSYTDLELLLTKKEIGAATPKTYKIQSNAMHGEIDYTDFFGEVKYNNRKIKLDFSTIVEQSTFLEYYSDIQDKLQGQQMQIIFDDDNTHYFLGRLSISAFTNDKCIGKISIECDCEPFKYDITPTAVTKSVVESESITLTNSKMRVVPTITTDADFTIEFNNNTWVTSAGTFTLPELELQEGDNVVDVEGTGTIIFTYRQGGL